MIDPESVVIVRGTLGYIAYVRFADAQYNIDISGTNKYYIHNAIERYWRKINE